MTSTNPPSRSVPPSSNQIPAPDSHLDPAAPPQNDSHYNVDSAGVDMNDRQFRIARCYPPPQIPTLRSVHPSGLQSLKSGHSSLRHAILLDSDSSDPGSARVAKETTDSPAGSCRAFFKADSPPINASQCIAAAEVTLKDGHKAPKRLST